MIHDPKLLRYNSDVMTEPLRTAFRFGVNAACLSIALILLFASTVSAQRGITQAEFKPPDWPQNKVFNFGIYNRQLERIGSAAYKIVIDSQMGLSNYTIRYNAKSNEMSEASTCIIDKRTLLPIRSTRKLIVNDNIYFQNATYSIDGVTVSAKTNDGAIIESFFPLGANDRIFDFEEMVPLIPQIRWDNSNKLYFYIFAASRYSASWVFIENQGIKTITWKDKIWKCTKLLIKSDFGDHYMYTTVYGGRTEIAKYDMGYYVFINLDLPSTGSIDDIEGDVSLETAMAFAGTQ